MRSDPTSGYCEKPNLFSEVITPTVEEVLPEQGSLAARALDHTTGIRPYLHAVTADLCDTGRIGPEGRDRTLGFFGRSVTSAAVVGGTVVLAGVGLAVGSPVLAIGAGIAGLAILPPLTERALVGAKSFIEGGLERFRQWRMGP